MIDAKRKTGEALRPDLLFDDILNYLVAGMEATGYVLSFGTYFLLNKPEAKAKLEAELREASPYIRDEFDHRKIMALPYLVCSLSISRRVLEIDNLPVGSGEGMSAVE